MGWSSASKPLCFWIERRSVPVSAGTIRVIMPVISSALARTAGIVAARISGGNALSRRINSSCPMTYRRRAKSKPIQYQKAALVTPVRVE